MPRISAKKLSLNVDGKIVELKNETKKNFELNKALNEPEGFKEFAKNPKDFVAKYNLNIDEEISKRLAEKLSRVRDLKDLKNLVHDGSNPIGATLWAVAVGSYSIASSKIAVAY